MSEKQETSRVWLVPDNANGTFWPKSAWGDPPPVAATLPYVPESELARVRRETWEAAIRIAQGWATSPSCNEEHTDNPCCHVRTGAGIADALTKARDESEGAVRKLDESVSGFKQRVVEAVRAFPAEANRAWIIRAIESLPVGKEADTDEK